MRGKFKKIISAISAAAVAATAFVAMPVSAGAATTEKVSVDYETDQTTKFTPSARFKTEIVTSTIEPNTTKVESMTGYESSGGYGYYTPLTAEDVENKIVNYEFDVYFGGRICYLSLSNGAQRYYDVTNRALTFGNNTNDGNVRIGSSTSFGDAEIVGLSSKWLHIVADVNNMTKSTQLKVYNTVDNGDYSNETPNYNQTVPFADTSLEGVTGFDFSTSHLVGIMIDNISISVTDIETIMHKVVLSVDGTTTEQYIADGNYITTVPDTAKTGYIFQGWYKDNGTTLYSTDAIKAMSITAATTFTAVYKENPDYIEPMASVEFSTFPSGGLLTAGADADTAASNLIDVTIKGELGTDLVANPDDNVTDLDVSYEIKGFNWKSHEQAVTADSEAWPYCDSYGRTVENGTTGIDFQLKYHPFNYYGQITATVTYNNETMTVSAPLVFIGDNTANTNSLQVLPRGGYYEDFDAYSPDMVGYETVVSSNNKGATDIITDNWASYGGNTRTLTLTEEDGNRFMRLNATGTNSSSFAANQITAVTDTQVVFDQMVRFHTSNSTIFLKSTNPVTWNDNATTFSLSYNNGNISLNGKEITSASAGSWYQILITSDVTSRKCYAEVYDESGTKLGKSDIVDFVNAGSVTPSFYMFRTPDNASGTLDFDKVKITRATIDSSTIKTTATNETIAIPETSGDTVTETLTVSANTSEGLPAIGLAEWSIGDDQISGVTVTPSSDDSHTATVSVESSATPGTLPINVIIGGVSTTINLTLTSSQDSIKFTESSSGISIPMSASETAVQNYTAAVVNGDGVAYDGKTITYALYDSSNTNQISAPEGVTFENGVLTVTSAAKACVVYVRATSTNSDGKNISRAVRVDIHGLAFDFGSGTAEDIVSGYTSVTSATTYNTTRKYGIEGTATSGGEASLTDASTDYLAGNYTFKADVPAAKFYTVKISYTGTLTSEYVSSALSGAALGTSTDLTEKEYTVPVIDDVLDLAISGNDPKIAYIIIEKQEDRQPREKPNIITIGDSTLSNQGSWAYTLSKTYENYPELNALATVSCNGQGGVNLSSYYTNGTFRDRALMNIYPGDYVTIGNMGTNGMSSTFKEDLNYYIDTCIALGANVILNSYSPFGAKGDKTACYDSDTQTFSGCRENESYEQIVKAVYAARQDELVGFIEIGENADLAFNAFVDNYATEGYESRGAAAQAIIDSFSDHNHYSGLACQLMLEGYGDKPGIVDRLAGWTATAENIGAEKSDTDSSTGFKFTISGGLLNIGQSFNSVSGTVTSDGITKSFTATTETSVTLGKDAACYVGLIVQGLNDSSATATMEIQ